MNELEIRTAHPKDIEVIGALAERIWKIHYPPIIGMNQVEYMLKHMYSRSAMEKDIKNGIVYRLAHLDNKPIGFSATERSGSAVVKLHKLYLDPHYQGNGYGARLLKDAEMVHDSASTVELQVNRKNFTAINFYFSQGYSIVEVFDKPIGEGFVMEDFIMKKTLNDRR